MKKNMLVLLVFVLILKISYGKTPQQCRNQSSRYSYCTDRLGQCVLIENQNDCAEKYECRYCAINGYCQTESKCDEYFDDFFNQFYWILIIGGIVTVVTVIVIVVVVVVSRKRRREQQQQLINQQLQANSYQQYTQYPYNNAQTLYTPPVYQGIPIQQQYQNQGQVTYQQMPQNNHQNNGENQQINQNANPISNN